MDKAAIFLRPPRNQLIQQRLANFLTLARVGFIPIMTALMYLDQVWASYTALAVFSAGGLYRLVGWLCCASLVGSFRIWTVS